MEAYRKQGIDGFNPNFPYGSPLGLQTQPMYWGFFSPIVTSPYISDAILWHQTNKQAKINWELKHIHEELKTIVLPSKAWKLQDSCISSWNECSMTDLGIKWGWGESCTTPSCRANEHCWDKINRYITCALEFPTPGVHLPKFTQKSKMVLIEVLLVEGADRNKVRVYPLKRGS